MGCLYRDVLTKDGDGSPGSSQEGARGAEWEPDSQRSSSQSEEPFNPQPDPPEDTPPPPAPQQIHINQPIRSLCGAVGAGSEGPLTVTGAIQTVSDEDILENRESEEGIRSIPRFQNYQPGIPSRVPPASSFIQRRARVAMETR